MKQAQKHMTGMEKWWWLFVCSMDKLMQTEKLMKWGGKFLGRVFSQMFRIDIGIDAMNCGREIGLSPPPPPLCND